MAKGGSYEIEISRRLSEWITGKRKPELFWRSAGSGSVGTVSRKTNKETNIIGDLMAIEQDGVWLMEHFAIEIKRGYGFKFDELLNRQPDLLDWVGGKVTTREIKKGKHKGKIKNVRDEKELILVWWEEIKRACEMTKRHPLLIMKKDQYPPYIVFDYRVATIMGNMFGDIPNDNIKTHDLRGEIMFISKLEDFLGLVDPFTLKEHFS